MIDPPLRIVFCTNGGLHGALVLGRLLASPQVRIVGIVLSSRLLRASYGFWRGAFEYWRLSGLAYTAYLWCSTSLANVLLGFSPVLSASAWARRNAIPRCTTRNVNDAGSRAFVERLAPDLLVSAFFNQRIDASPSSLPRLGAINIHPSPLPDFRGVDPMFFATLSRRAELGVSIHRIANEFDAGNVLRRETQPARSDESVFWATARLYDRGGELLVTALEDIAQGERGVAQPAGGRYDSWPTRKQVAQLRRQGGRLVRMRDLLNLFRGRLPRNESRVR